MLEKDWHLSKVEKVFVENRMRTGEEVYRLPMMMPMRMMNSENYPSIWYVDERMYQLER